MNGKIRTIIVVDELLARNLLKSYLGGHDKIEIIAECENGFDGLKAINEMKPDLVFLDVQMPKLTGFESIQVFVKNSSPYKGYLDKSPALTTTRRTDVSARSAVEVSESRSTRNESASMHSAATPPWCGGDHSTTRLRPMTSKASTRMASASTSR